MVKRGISVWWFSPFINAIASKGIRLKEANLKKNEIASACTNLSG